MTQTKIMSNDEEEEKKLEKHLFALRLKKGEREKDKNTTVKDFVRLHAVRKPLKNRSKIEENAKNS